MAGGNGTVALYVRIPKELRILVDRYQSDRRKQSLSDTIVELLETHPRIASVVQELYNGGAQEDN